MMRFWTAAALSALCLIGAFTTVGTVAVRAQAATQKEQSRDERSLGEAPKVERQTLQALLQSDRWPRRAIAALRLERFRDPESAAILRRLLHDDVWQVRAFAVRALGQRGDVIDAEIIDQENNPRVLRAALRHGVDCDSERIANGVRNLADSSDNDRRMLAVELAAATNDPELHELATPLVKKIIYRMDRAECGRLSPRLAKVTGAENFRKQYKWKKWAQSDGRKFELRPAAESETHSESLLATLSSTHFSKFEQYLSSLRRRDVDLCLVIDCTGSMSGELAEAQGGVDDLMIAMQNIAASMRVGIVGFRDHRNEFEIAAWDFTSDIDEARLNLWRLTADEGGDTPELVFPALRKAYQQLTWQADHEKVVVLIGDAPPHPGFGAQCVDLARRGFEAGCTTHVIQCRERPVKHFAEIAQEGGGRLVVLADNDALPGHIVGMAAGEGFDDEFRAFFATYLELCR